jgi:hypothetical protein
MAKNNGKWTITRGDPGELRDHAPRTFKTRREAADYAARLQDAGAYDLIVTTPDGRRGALGSADGAYKSHWL